MSQKKDVLLFLSSLAVATAALPAHALVYSSSLKYKLADFRVSPEDFENYVKGPADKVASNAISAQEAPAPVGTSTLENTKVNSHSREITKLKGKIPARHSQQARIFVVDEEALLNGRIKPINGVTISLISPALKGGPSIVTRADGLARVPYPLSESLRFFAHAPDYMVAMGYATFGNVTLVPLLSKKRYSTLQKSLGINTSGGQLAVFAKLIDSDLRGIANSQVQFDGVKPPIVYCGPFLGGIPGYCMERFNHTDQTGSFIVNGLSRTQHKISIVNGEKTIPGFNFDLSGIPEHIKTADGKFEPLRFITLALQNGPSINIASSILDGEAFERPEVGIHAFIENHSINPDKPLIPDEEGSIWLETRVRPTINNIKIKSVDEKSGYLPTYLSQLAHSSLFPPTIGLFTHKQILNTLSDINRSWDTSESLVFGHIYPQKEFKHAAIQEVSLAIFNSSGEKVPAEILYFDSDNILDPRKTTTDAHHQNFLVLGLDEGEYHFSYRNNVRGTGLGLQVVRIKRGGITQVDF